MITPGNHTSQMAQNLSWNKETLSVFKCHFQELSLKLLCNVSCTSLLDKTNFPRWANDNKKYKPSLWKHFYFWLISIKLFNLLNDLNFDNINPIHFASSGFSIIQGQKLISIIKKNCRETCLIMQICWSSRKQIQSVTYSSNIFSW